MSIKKLFESTDTERNYSSDKTQKEAFKDVESERNLQQLKDKQSEFVPQVDYSNPVTFAKYGSAYYYYKGGIEHILDYYPYDGSDAEINKFYNGLLGVEKYVFDSLYPRTNGHIRLSANGWGTLSSATNDGYGLPSSLEYIDFKGGPGVGLSGSTLASMSPNPYSNKFQDANIYDTDIYKTAGLPASYGKGTRESNLKADFGRGVTIEFWLKKAEFTNSKTNKEVIVDIWNNESSGSHAYGRITVELTGTAGSTPFLITAQSGTTNGFFQQTIGQDLTPTSLEDFQHYAVVLYNTGSQLVSRLYVNGGLNDVRTNTNTLGEINQKNLVGRLGALLVAPSTSSAGGSSAAAAGSGKLSASLDEFRYWKEARSAQDIGRHWFSQVRGGVNSDIANTTLGVYYKFNEGITGDSDIDSTVLDYGGRISNGTWTGYDAGDATGTSGGRSLLSAIVEASGAAKEYKDPIIYASHPQVQSLKTILLESGSVHDTRNNAAFVNYAPAWVLEQHEDEGNNNLPIISHIMGSYFDKIYLYSSQIPKLKQINYTSASSKPVPFAEHLPQSLGLYTPELFVDANVMELFLNRDEDSLFEGDLNDTKNLIYLNLYNNLTNIYKSKGTEKALRNVLRCFNVDERLVKINTYANNTTYTLNNNFEQVIEKRKFLNFNKPENRDGVVYQSRRNLGPLSGSGFISGSNPGTGSVAGKGSGSFEEVYGATIEANFILPKFFATYDSFDRNYVSSSLFGLYTVDGANSASLSGSDTTWVSDDIANFQVFAVKDSETSKNVRFELKSLRSPYPLPVLSSSIFANAYDDTQWNLSVRVKPSKYPLASIVSGAFDSNYDVEFTGYNVDLGSIQNSFKVTGTIDQNVGRKFLTAPKRLYIGARRTNVNGALLNKSDVLFASARYWIKYLQDGDLAFHARDFDNYGISGSYQNITAVGSSSIGNDIRNLDMLALNWDFNTVTGSGPLGGFTVLDISSGSNLITPLDGGGGPILPPRVPADGWVGNIAGMQHPGSGSGFATSSLDVVIKERMNAFRFIEPERVTSANMVQILSEDDKVFGVVETVPSFVHTVEKSMYRAISEEMLNFFAGVVDFNNIIGEPVNRYRGRYKSLEKLRELFFRRVNKVSDVEKFIAYYKWFDDAISIIMGQLMPASSEFAADTYNTVESHVLERNKYRTQYPTIDVKAPDPEAAFEGGPALGYNYQEGSTTLAASPRPQDKHEYFWKARALRTSDELTSGDATVDAQREIYRKVVYSAPTLQTPPFVVSTPDGDQYKNADEFAKRNFQKPTSVAFTNLSASAIKGGVNFKQPRNMHFVYNALYPFGPINTGDDGQIFVPQNVLLAEMLDLVGLPVNFDNPDLKRKIKRVVKVQHGRDWEDGIGYNNMKSSFAFPFNIMSSSLKTGYNKHVYDRVTGGIEITNLHHDVYGGNFEIPMQGTFTEAVVGGHQSRHIGINTGSSGGNLANKKTRPEAWRLLLGSAPVLSGSGSRTTGSLGMVGVDYPDPDVGAGPLTASGKITLTGVPSQDQYVEIADGGTGQNQYRFVYNPSSGVSGKTASWGAGANTGSAAQNLANAINTLYNAGDLSITASNAVDVGDEDDQQWVVDLSNTEFGTPVSRRIKARGSKGNIAITDAASNVTVLGMSGGADPVILNFNAPRAVYYRDPLIKRPVNIKNIQMRTGSTIIGNYEKNYQVVNTVGAWQNPRAFIENPPKLPDIITSQANLSGTIQMRNFLALPMPLAGGGGKLAGPAGGGRYNMNMDYTVTDISGNTNKSVITSRFGAPGGRETMARGFQDVRAGEFSVYNTINFRNLTVHRKSQGPSGSLSDQLKKLRGSDERVESVKVYDIHGRDYGSRSHLARHNARFGRDSLYMTGTYDSILTGGSVVSPDGQTIDSGNPPGKSYDQLPAFHKTNRNRVNVIKLTASALGNDGLGAVTASQFDNYYVTHAIPRSTKQYAWITASATNTYQVYEYTPANFKVRRSGSIYGAHKPGDVYEDAIDFVSASKAVALVSGRYDLHRLKSGSAMVWGYDQEVIDQQPAFDYIPVDFAGLNTIIYEPISSSINTLGYPNLQGGDRPSPDAVSVANFRFLNILNRFQLTGGAGSLSYDLTNNNFDGSLYASSGSLQGWWRLDEDVSSAGDVVDSSGKGKTGTFDASNDRPAYTEALFPTPYIQTASCTFDGTSDRVNIGGGATWDAIIGNDTGGGSTQQMTFAAWIYVDDSPAANYPRIISFGLNPGVTFQTHKTSLYLSFDTYWSTSGHVNWETAASVLTKEKWHHVVATYDGSSTANDAKIYLDGVLISAPASESRVGTWPGIDSNNCYIGNNANDLGTQFTGQIADVGVWNTILTANEVRALYYASGRVNAGNSMTPLNIAASSSVVGWAPNGAARALNGLLLHRQGPYGHPSWKQVRQHYHPIVRKERRENMISVLTGSAFSASLARYDLRPVSTRGRPALLNFDQIEGTATPVRNNVTLKMTDNNETIYFNQKDFNDFAIDLNDPTVTLFDQMVDITKPITTGSAWRPYDLNWIVYSQNVYPSLKNEYKSSSYQRVGYDSLYWRPTAEGRRKLFDDGGGSSSHRAGTAADAGQEKSGFYNSWGIPKRGYSRTQSYLNGVYFGSVIQTLTQSSWPLDAPKDFLARTASIAGQDWGWVYYAYGNQGFQALGQAGELQNTYFHYLGFGALKASAFVNWTYTIPSAGNTNQYVFELQLRGGSPGALYSRKHALPSPFSVRAPSGRPIAGVWPSGTLGGQGSGGPRGFLQPLQYEGRSHVFSSDQSVDIGGGEALWEAPSQAGIVMRPDPTNADTGEIDAVESAKLESTFASYPSAPFWDSYEDFNEDLKLVGKDYSVVPEFRISEHVEDYNKFGVFNPNKFDTFEIFGSKAANGSRITSATSSFYNDYSNSEFLKDFLKVKVDSLLDAKEIKLTCNAVVRFNPYKGFYPAQRTIDLVSQFSRSYGPRLEAWYNQNPNSPTMTQEDTSRLLYFRGKMLQPILQPICSPGILYNSIKSGMAVDYPIISDPTKILKYPFGKYDVQGTGSLWPPTENSDGLPAGDTMNWMITVNKNHLQTSLTDITGYSDQSTFWNKRIPFEGIIRPEDHLMGVVVADIEPHPSCSAMVTASMKEGSVDATYTMMAQNFFGEVGSFFLKDETFSKLESKIVTDDLRFVTGSVYAARIKMRRSVNAFRQYIYESGAQGGNTPYTIDGAVAYGVKVQEVGFGAPTASFPLPQDPRQNPRFAETFTMYSRPTAFGPPIAGRPTGSAYGTISHTSPTGRNVPGQEDAPGAKNIEWEMTPESFQSNYFPADSLNGFNWSFTPPYYHGEAWADILFWPRADKSYDLEQILSECFIQYYRFDNGVVKDARLVTPTNAAPFFQGSLINSGAIGCEKFNASAGGGSLDLDYSAPYGGNNINANAMQLTASVNLLGVERVQFVERDQFGNPISDRNTSIGGKWVIKPKFETPMMNFNDSGSHSIRPNINLTLPTNFAAESTPRGMWHQFGTIPDDPEIGVFLEIGDIPVNWLQNHPTVRAKDTPYNNFQADVLGNSISTRVQSLSDLFGFEKDTSSIKMGQLADSRTIKEAIVAVPYVLDQVDNLTEATPAVSMTRKKFIEIPKIRFEAALRNRFGSAEGDSLEAAGASIRKMVQQMEDFVFPPQFDFLKNPDIKPITMYVFEFEYTFDRDDLSYMWQNLAPRNYKKMTFQSETIVHELADNELLSERNLLDNENLRWMVFKVKQRAKQKWSDHQVPQAGRATSQPFLDDALRGQDQQTGYEVQYNWPYDFVSFVELAKIDVDVLFRNKNVEVDVPIDPAVMPPPRPPAAEPSIAPAQRILSRLLEERERNQAMGLSHTHALLDNGYTSVEDGHKHSYTLDINGNGQTSYDAGHMHTISRKVVAPIYEDQQRREEMTEEAPPGTRPTERRRNDRTERRTPRGTRRGRRGRGEGGETGGGGGTGGTGGGY